MYEKVYAKTNPVKSIHEHNADLEKSYDEIRKSNYIDKNRFEKYDTFIRIMIKYHDYGKLNFKFQNKIRAQLGLEPLIVKELKDYKEIPHEWLSLCFISEEDEDYLDDLSDDNSDEIDFDYLMSYCIAYHHSRYNKIYDNDIIKLSVNHDLEPNKHKLNIDYPLRSKINVENLKDITSKKENFLKYFPYLVLFKGLLHKCDYSASGNTPAEVLYKGNYENDFHKSLTEKGFVLRDYQVEAKSYSDKSIVFIAFTGAGKTEYSMNWINGKKAFYLLGLRIAVNKMFKRFKDVFNDNCVLLHSEVNFKVVDETDDRDEYFQKINTIKKLSYPITIATADQLITSVFKYNGFELPYFVASYSKIVVDEIQSFSPEAIASIVTFLKEIHMLGGRFLLMTATLPPFIKDEFKKINDIVFPEPVLTEKKRHKIKMYDSEIIDETVAEMIKEQYKSGKKVLVVCNTVKMLQELAKLLDGLEHNVIHSQFIVRDKKKKEKQIMEAVKRDIDNGPCIWIATQVVEASLDIDFDVLFTECSTVDSLFQRFGRCWRNRGSEYENDEANIHIVKPSKNSIYIYDKEILKRTEKALVKFDDKVITEKDKQNIIDEVFSDIENTSYYENYKKYKDLLELGYKAENKSEAQDLFRKIENNYTVIPEPVFTNNKADIEEFLNYISNNSNSYIERIKAKSKLYEYTMGLRILGSDKKNCLEEIDNDFCRQYRIFKLNGVNYDANSGITYKEDYKDKSNFLF